MLVSQGINKLLLVVGLLCVFIVLFLRGRIVGVSELCSYVSFYSLHVWPVGSRTQARVCVN